MNRGSMGICVTLAAPIGVAASSLLKTNIVYCTYIKTKTKICHT